jgi:hypothetical protein
MILDRRTTRSDYNEGGSVRSVRRAVISALAAVRLDNDRRSARIPRCIAGQTAKRIGRVRKNSQDFAKNGYHSYFYLSYLPPCDLPVATHSTLTKPRNSGSQSLLKGFESHFSVGSHLLSVEQHFPPRWDMDSHDRVVPLTAMGASCDALE